MKTTGWRKRQIGDHRVATEPNTELLKSRCDAFLIGLVGSEELAKQWWTSYNKAFKHTPAAQFEIDPHSVHDYLMSHCMGNL